jgi:hypothetical protein
MAEPQTPPIRVASAIETCASPPRSRPVRTEARLRSCSVIPDLFITLPATMNSGTASSAKFCVCDTVTCIGIVNGNSECWRKNSVPEMPMAKATGMPISNKTPKAMATMSIART